MSDKAPKISAPPISKREQAKRDAVAKQRADRDAREDAEIAQSNEFVIDLTKLTEPAGALRVSEDTTYPLRQWDLFSHFEQKDIDRQWRRIIAIEQSETISEEESNEYATLARTVLARICDIPEDALAALNTTQQLEGCGAYFGAQQGRQRARLILLATMTGALPIGALSPSASTRGGQDQEAPQSG